MQHSDNRSGGWRWCRALPLLAALGLGAVVMGGFVTLVEATNRTEFCISCHSMQQNHAEYRQSPHYLNRSGAHAQCADCHVPKELGAKLVRKVMAVNDVVAEVRGVLDTEEKRAARRPILAERVWAYMGASQSRECRSCHSFESMDPARQGTAARLKHAAAAQAGQTCIDCHRGVAHKLPAASKDDL